mmetsp:Transcript_54617/g.63060  ORF Transcript_54617/g.63060 Transcript_54617/m.63060 type:complete len:1167 (+) Transcript_54617:89-3589(+)
MSKHIINDMLIILEKGGVKLPGNVGNGLDLSKLLSILESWLGLSTADASDDRNDGDMEVMEDMAPFDGDFYRALENILVNIWNPEETSHQPLFGTENDFEDNDNVESVSLYKSVGSIRITRSISYWMELNVTGRESLDESEHTHMLSFQLLKHSSFDIKAISASNSDMKLKSFPLIRALYHHIEQLPYLQSQIYLYVQSLARENIHNASNLNRPGLGLANPQSRLAQLQMSQQVKAKLEREFDDHIGDLEKIVGEWYAIGSVDIRRHCRAQMGSVWSIFEARSSGVGGSISGAGIRSEITTSSGIAMTLRILYRIILGITEKKSDRQISLCKSHEHLLFHHLIPLHRPNSMVLWRDQTSLLELYHEPLVQCIAALVRKKPEWIGKVIERLLENDIWNKSAGNTPKLVLLLHEIDTYIGCLPGELNDIRGTELVNFPSLLRTLGSCMASENSRLAQRALPFVKNKIFVKLMETNLGLSLEVLLPFLLRKQPSWNPTVKKMTYNVLKTLQDFDHERFSKVGNQCLINERQKKPSVSSSLHNSKNSAGAQKKHFIENSTRNETSLPADYTIKAALGTWTPSSNSGVDGVSTNSSAMPRNTGRSGIMMPPPSNCTRKALSGKNSPSTITGVAPWAKTSSSKGAKSASSRRKNPPLGVTGVAPWAMKNNKHHLSSTIDLENASPRSLELKLSKSEVIESKPCPVLAYMKKIKPPKEEENASSWSKDQMAESPTLLPTLKFHDLVFGHDLGEGAFGSVRYARLIDRTTTRSHWPEYAVKVISTQKIKEMGYEASVQRELAVLRMLCHPCISRLISSFRFREGVYLVLEYASGGDLHTMLKNNGSLDHDSTRFVIGEVTSALASIHQIGLGYFDLKPENIIITESGHVKLTDFGGSRPVTLAAKEMVSNSAKNVFRQLRDGDWKSREKKMKAYDMDDNEEIDEIYDGFLYEYDLDTDLRIEGTTIYLPPEVIMGSFQTLAADSWALGCVLYQCLTGRPPIIDVEETLAKNRIVSFDIKGDENILFGDDHAANMEKSARDLITQLLNRNANERPTMYQVADHPFFQDNGTDIFTLWLQPAVKLEVGHNAQPPADAGWARRQLSCIWAPQPQAYDISWDSKATPAHPNSRVESGPIFEGEEATTFFSKSHLLPSIRPASHVIPMPPRKKVEKDKV